MNEKRKKILVALIRSFNVKDAGSDIEILDNPDGLFTVKVNVDKIDIMGYGNPGDDNMGIDYEEEIYDDMDSRMMEVAEEVDRIVNMIYPKAFNDDVITDYPYIYVSFE